LPAGAASTRSCATISELLLVTRSQNDSMLEPTSGIRATQPGKSGKPESVSFCTNAVMSLVCAPSANPAYTKGPSTTTRMMSTISVAAHLRRPPKVCDSLQYKPHEL